MRAACEVLPVAQAGYYRRHRTSSAPVRAAPVPNRDRVQPRALSSAERRAILAELVATEPNQVYSWDITKLRGPGKWT